MSRRLRTTLCLWIAITASIETTARSDDVPAAREQIGHVLGKPIYRDEVESKSGNLRKDELVRRFAGPVGAKYREEHQEEIVPTKAEIDAVTAYFDARHEKELGNLGPKLRDELQAVETQLSKAEAGTNERQRLENERLRLQSKLNPPGRFFSEFLLKNWKFQRHLYDNFGGGRVLWQQAGLEAFDATRKWLESEEQKGRFFITDPALREAFYEYWTRSHGPFMVSDEARIRSEFLEPEWAPKGSGGDGSKK